MPSVVHERDIDEPERCDPDDEWFDDDPTFKVSSTEGTAEVYSPDEACELICDLVAEQFWEWFDNPDRGHRFKPRVKIYEV